MKKRSHGSLRDKLDKVFSRWIRKKYANHGGWTVCVTCGKEVHWTEVHAGHFVRRQHMAVRWDERNVHPQCCYCNTFRHGNEGEYSRYILDRYGREVLDELLNAKRIAKKWRPDELQELIARYEEV